MLTAPLQVNEEFEYPNEGSLFDYQVTGVNWMLDCYFQNRGCILADEMGLGKTIQVSLRFKLILRQ